ncbi:hypothetical protein [Paraburkholderia guartelaensis]|nr:hypothetical protein [Paraburkholderia guartelaensis]
MMEKVFHFAESPQNVNRLVSQLGRGVVSVGLVAAGILIAAFFFR